MHGYQTSNWRENLNNPAAVLCRFSPAHTIAQFAKKALSDRLPGETPSKAVISGFVFVCRQMYNTCDGLMVLNPYELHQHVANAWIKVTTPSDPSTIQITML